MPQTMPAPRAAPRSPQAAEPMDARDTAAKDNPQSGAEMFDALLEQSRQRFDPGAVVNIVADAFEQIVPRMQQQLRDRMLERMEQQEMPPEMRDMIRQMNEQVVGQIFARAATVLRTDELDSLRGIKPETDATQSEGAEQ